MKMAKKIRRYVAPFLIILLGVVALIMIGKYASQFALSSNVRYAIEGGNATDLQKLLQMGANPNGVKGGLLGGTPLIWATKRSDVKSIKVLIQGGVDVNGQIDNGETALMYATSPEVACLLLDAGANPKTRDSRGLTAWDYAKHDKLTEVIKVFQSKVGKK